MALPIDHPFARFNEYLYMESGSQRLCMPIYIWKKGSKGILVELYLNDRINGPRARLYTLIFEDEYLFKLDRNIKNINNHSDEDFYPFVAESIKEALDNL